MSLRPLSRVVVHVLGTIQRFDDARALETVEHLQVVRDGKLIARFERFAVASWWHEERA